MGGVNNGCVFDPCAGFELVDELDFGYSKSSHFTRKANGEDTKRSRESMLVMRRAS